MIAELRLALSADLRAILSTLNVLLEAVSAQGIELTGEERRTVTAGLDALRDGIRISETRTPIRITHDVGFGDVCENGCCTDGQPHAANVRVNGRAICWFCQIKVDPFYTGLQRGRD